MRSIIAWTVRNTPAMNVLVVAVMVVGWISFSSMRREVFPEFDLEMALVTVAYPGATPEEVEEGICQKVEEACRSVVGIKKITSVAREGAGFCVFEMNDDVADPQRVVSEIRSEVERIPSFPELAEDAKVEQVTLRSPAIKVGVLAPTTSDGGERSELELREVAEKVRDDLLALPTVSAVNIAGGKDYELTIEISEETLRKHGLTLKGVADIVRRENLELPGGTIRSEGGEVLLRGKNKKYVGGEIARIPLVTLPDGLVLTVGDLGTVRDGFVDVAGKSRINGRQGMAVSVDRSSGEDLLAMVAAVKQYVADANLPPGYELVTWADASVDVRERLDMLMSNGTQGLLIVFVILAMFFDLKIGFWVAMGVPVSMLGTGALMYGFDQTLNMLSMFAFLMAVGIDVDDAIVVSDNVERHRRMGKGPIQAAIEGTAEVVPSVVSGVMTTVITFMPLLFVSGVMGKFIAVMPFAFIATLLVSLSEAIFVLPGHLAHDDSFVLRVFRFLCTPLKPFSPILKAVQRGCDDGLKWFVKRAYAPALEWSINNRWAVLAGAASILILAVALIRSGTTPFKLFPKVDSKRLIAKIVYPDGTPASVTEAGIGQVERALDETSKRLSAGGRPIVTFVHASVGSFETQGKPGSEQKFAGSHLGAVSVELEDAINRTIDSETFVSEWRKAAGELPGADSVVFQSENIGPAGKAIEFKLLSASDDDSVRQLEEAVERSKSWLADYPGVIDIDDDSRPGKWEYQMKVKPRAETLGVSLAEVASTIRASFYGEEVMRLQRGRHEVKLMVAYPRDERRTFTVLDDVQVRGADGAARPLTEVADVTAARGYSEINRLGQKRSITITADVDANAGITSGQIIADLQQKLLPEFEADYPAVRVRWEGEQEQTNESLRSLGLGFTVSVFAMFVLLTIEFRSYLQPLLILTAIPFGAAGAVFGHAIMGMPLSLFTMFGVVALAGIVVNDSIVLIDFINARVREGRPLHLAIREAGCVRFRPVFLTSITTVGGLLPLLFDKSFQAQFLIPMAAAMTFGEMVTTVLILIMIPVAYSFIGGQMPEEHDEQDVDGRAAGSTDEGDEDWLPAYLQEGKPQAQEA
ncbi:MAG: efflux RND transporter permease subunit [Pirellulales bacterium]